MTKVFAMARWIFRWWKSNCRYKGQKAAWERKKKNSCFPEMHTFSTLKLRISSPNYCNARAGAQFQATGKLVISTKWNHTKRNIILSVCIKHDWTGCVGQHNTECIPRLALFSLVSFALHVYNSRRAVFIRLLTILWANNIEGYEGIPEICIYIYIHTYRLIQSVCNHTTDWQNQTWCLAFVYHQLIKTSENSNETFVGKKGWMYSKIKNKTVDVFLRENRPIGLFNQRTKLFSTSKSEKRNGLMLLH